MPFKSVSIPFPSNTPHEAMRVMPQIASFLCLLNLLGQLAKSSTTPLGMTQLIPNRENTIFHISLVTGQWTSKWSVVFPLLLHIQHQSTITIWHLCKLSIFKIFPNADIQRKKKKTFVGTLGFHELFHGKDCWIVECNTLYYDLLQSLLRRRIPAKLIRSTPHQWSRINQIQIGGNQLYPQSWPYEIRNI